MIAELEWGSLKPRVQLYAEFLRRNDSIIDLIQILDANVLSQIPSNAIFLDIETELFGSNQDGEPPFIGAISLLHYDSRKEMYFFSGTYATQRKFLAAVERYIQRFKISRIFAWSNYDNNVLAQAGFKYTVENIIPILRKAVFLPSYKLKILTKILGITHSPRLLDDGKYWGLLIGHLLKDGDNCSFCQPLLTELQEYNMEDVRAIAEILDILNQINAEKSPTP
jgi:predicted RecB family nuclease